MCINIILSLRFVNFKKMYHSLSIFWIQYYSTKRIFGYQTLNLHLPQMFSLNRFKMFDSNFFVFALYIKQQNHVFSTWNFDMLHKSIFSNAKVMAILWKVNVSDWNRSLVAIVSKVHHVEICPRTATWSRVSVNDSNHFIANIELESIQCCI
jgi:hypothetical protein